MFSVTATNGNKKAVAYVRVSSTRQIDNESPATQRDKIQAYADANSTEIIKWYYDEAKSARTLIVKSYKTF